MLTANALSPRCCLPIGRAAVAAIAWQYKGEVRVTAVVKATFAFASEAAMARVDPQPIVADELHEAGNPLRSIRLAGDLVPHRRRADVVFTGHAHAPAGSSVESASVRFGVASGDRVVLDKVLHIRKKGGFQRIALTWEHTAGGPGHAENLYGESEGSTDLNIFDPANPARPVGYGPLAAAMPARARRLGSSPAPRFGASAIRVPDAFDFDFFQAAPTDQQIGYLRGDEWILLENMHPSQARLRMALPQARAVARIFGLGDEGKALALNADGLHVIGDEERCTVTWRGSFAVAGEAALGAVRIVAGVELPGEPITWPDPAEIERAAAAPVARTPSKTAAIDETLPLVGNVNVLVARSSLQGTLDAPASIAKDPWATLPFRAPIAGVPSAMATPGGARSRSGSSGETLPIPSSADRAPRIDPLPWSAAPAPAPTPPEEAPPPAPEPPPAPKRVIEVRSGDGSPWAPQPAAPSPTPPRAPEKVPPKVDVKSKLYGPRKKG